MERDIPLFHGDTLWHSLLASARGKQWLESDIGKKYQTYAAQSFGTYGLWRNRDKNRLLAKRRLVWVHFCVSFIHLGYFAVQIWCFIPSRWLNNIRMFFWLQLGPKNGMRVHHDWEGVWTSYLGDLESPWVLQNWRVSAPNSHWKWSNQQIATFSGSKDHKKHSYIIQSRRPETLVLRHKMLSSLGSWSWDAKQTFRKKVSYLQEARSLRSGRVRSSALDMFHYTPTAFEFLIIFFEFFSSIKKSIGRK